MGWMQCLRFAFDIDLCQCPRCGAALRVLAVITDPRVIAAMLEHIDTRAAPEPPVAPSGSRPRTAPRSRHDLAMVEQSLRELALRLRERQHHAEGISALVIERPRPGDRGGRIAEGLGPQGRDELIPELARREGDVVGRDRSPVLAVHRAVDHERDS